MCPHTYICVCICACAVQVNGKSQRNDTRVIAYQVSGGSCAGFVSLHPVGTHVYASLQEEGTKVPLTSPEWSPACVDLYAYEEVFITVLDP